MMPSLDPALVKVLGHFYYRFQKQIIDARIKMERKSMLLTVIKIPVNQLSKLLTDSTIDNSSIPQNELDALIYKGYIRSLDELGKPNEYAITARGIWCLEFHNNEMDIDRLIDYFQETKLSFKVSGKPLKDIEKTVLFAMIAVRTFSSNLPMDTKSSSVDDYWIEIFDLCAKNLYEIGVVKKENWHTFQSGNEHPISYVMRHVNDLPQKTVHIYQNLGNNKYFLDIDTENTSPQKQLLFLYKLILGKIETKDLIDKTYKVCCDIAYDKSKNVSETLEYINPEWDSILKDALKDLYYDS